MRNRWFLVWIVPLLLILSACTAPAPARTESTVSDSPSGTPAPSTPLPTASASSSYSLVISVDGLAVEIDGTISASAPFADGAGTLALLTSVLDAEPVVSEPQEGYEIDSYDWGGLAINVVRGGPASVFVSTAEIEGLALRTTEGVTVDTTRAEAESLGGVEDSYDGDGDGVGDSIRFQIKEVPGTSSLSVPGQTGVDFVLLNFNGDDAVTILAPGSDWNDL